MKSQFQRILTKSIEWRARQREQCSQRTRPRADFTTNRAGTPPTNQTHFHCHIQHRQRRVTPPAPRQRRWRARRRARRSRRARPRTGPCQGRGRAPGLGVNVYARIMLHARVRDRWVRERALQANACTRTRECVRARTCVFDRVP